MEKNMELDLNGLSAVSGGEGAAPETVIAYYEDGRPEYLIPQGDGTTFLTLRGAVYYLGDDGVYRNREYTDLYATNPVV